MDALIAFVAIVVSLIGFDAAAVAWGADSRESMADDHAR
jgi:phage-related minor tail protein